MLIKWNTETHLKIGPFLKSASLPNTYIPMIVMSDGNFLQIQNHTFDNLQIVRMSKDRIIVNIYLTKTFQIPFSLVVTDINPDKYSLSTRTSPHSIRIDVFTKFPSTKYPSLYAPAFNSTVSTTFNVSFRFDFEFGFQILFSIGVFYIQQTASVCSTDEIQIFTGKVKSNLSTRSWLTKSNRAPFVIPVMITSQNKCASCIFVIAIDRVIQNTKHCAKYDNRIAFNVMMEKIQWPLNDCARSQYVSNSEGCHGSTYTHSILSKCYFIDWQHKKHRISWLDAQTSCERKGGQLAVFEKPLYRDMSVLKQLKNALWVNCEHKTILTTYSSFPLFIGLKSTVGHNIL